MTRPLLVMAIMAMFHSASSALGQTCLMSTNAEAIAAAQTPEEIVAALKDAQLLNPRLQRFRDRLIVHIETKSIVDRNIGFQALPGSSLEKFAHGLREVASQQFFALIACDIVRPMLRKFADLDVVEVHGYIRTYDHCHNEFYDARTAWIAFRRATADRVNWSDVNDIIAKADGKDLSFQPRIEFGRWRPDC